MSCASGNRESVEAIPQSLSSHGVPIHARGAGTGLSGGASRIHGGVYCRSPSSNKISRSTLPACTAAVQCGVRMLWPSARTRLPTVVLARPQQPDRLHHRRQRGMKLRRSGTASNTEGIAHQCAAGGAASWWRRAVEFGSRCVDADGLDHPVGVVGSEGGGACWRLPRKHRQARSPNRSWLAHHGELR